MLSSRLSSSRWWYWNLAVPSCKILFLLGKSAFSCCLALVRQLGPGLCMDKVLEHFSTYFDFREQKARPFSCLAQGPSLLELRAWYPLLLSFTPWSLLISFKGRTSPQMQRLGAWLMALTTFLLCPWAIYFDLFLCLPTFSDGALNSLNFFFCLNHNANSASPSESWPLCLLAPWSIFYSGSILFSWNMRCL